MAIELKKATPVSLRSLQGETLDELRSNLQEVIEMLLEDGAPQLESVFIGTQTVEVA